MLIDFKVRYTTRDIIDDELGETTIHKMELKNRDGYVLVVASDSAKVTFTEMVDLMREQIRDEARRT